MRLAPFCMVVYLRVGPTTGGEKSFLSQANIKSPITAAEGLHVRRSAASYSNVSIGSIKGLIFTLYMTGCG